MVLVSLFNGSSGSSSKEELPTRPKPERSAMLTPAIQLHPLTSEDGLLVKIQPPRGPKDSQLNHVPCDLVLSIDVSGSMGASAPIPARPAEKQEEFGLSVLDLVKHAARTIMETLDSRDRLGIVTFSSRATVLQELTRMTASNKANTLEKIEGMRPLDLTNLWHGIRDGLGLFNTGEEDRGGRVPALLVLTDGMPNYMCPPRGYIPKLRAMEPLPATIHTFGFGYQLRSGLLKSIAEVGGGNYSFIPDAGMIGTVFIHAVANLQSTFANNATLHLTYPSYLQLEETTGEAQSPIWPVPRHLPPLRQHQQNPLKVLANTDTPPIINVLLEYQHFTPTIHRAVAHKSALDVSSPLDPAEIAYHVSRSSLISFLSILCPLNAEFEHEPWLTLPDDLPEYLRELAATLPAADEKFATSHAGCRSLMLDLCGSPTAAAAGAPPASWTGQIALALTNRDHYARWGMHYLPSLAGAHARQVCNSFKDPGPLLYATDSPLFLTCRDRLDAAFDTLPAPAPSIPPPGKGDGAAAGGSPPAPAAPVSMWRYRDMDGTCFAGCARVAVVIKGGAEGGVVKEVRIGRLRNGMWALTPKGPRKVAAVLRTGVASQAMCLVGSGGLLVTPWHPVSMHPSGEWVYPKEVAKRSIRYTGSMYSILLERHEDADAHAILVNGVWGVTLGHGLIAGDKTMEIRVHGFLGNYDKIRRALGTLPKRSGGVVLGGGVTRDRETGLINGFRRPEMRYVKALPTGQMKVVVYD
ncbi:Inter-alpha-trypsin inhibitor heavy chain H3 [Madurella mycetomatis]|uniref:Inter-alpha-trypsin inhibitor heavy chain H3 n=1 Tax=Madurella mycetomatis TaxID=100816 RepID=A0A175W520_9PEZI|nr:Inter-alpha-trypsin inhibitor heavy chain H3 [Madurella mycetomatis]